MRGNIPKLVELVVKELREINPKWIKHYELIPSATVQLIHGETSIILISSPHYGKLYEVYPTISGKDFKELFGTTDVVSRFPSLKDAVEISEYTLAAKDSPFFYQKLKELVKEKF